jgi:hypothetical protein
VTVPVLIISGTIGAGKSTVLYECTDILEARGEPYAAVELDALSMLSPRPGDDPNQADLAFENLVRVWENMARRGAARLLVGAVVETREELARYAEAIPGAEITVCLLTASTATIERRLAGREIGSALGWHLERSRDLDVILREARVHDFAVSNDIEIVENVASDVLRRSGWID